MIKSNFIIAAAIILAAGFIFEANAQTRRKVKPRRSKIVRQQPILPVQTLEPVVISRAEDELNEQNAAANPENNAESASAQPVRPRQKQNSPKGTTSEAEENGLRDLERLTLAEERAGALRRQLEEIIDREAALRSKLEQLDYHARPEMIEREVAVIGTLRPEVERENRRKIIENEKKRTNDQLTQVTANRTRLEGAVANADMLVDKLRARVETTVENDKTGRDKVTSSDSDPPEENNLEENPNLQ